MNRRPNKIRRIVRRAFGGVFARWPFLETWAGTASFIVVKWISQGVPAVIITVLTFKTSWLDIWWVQLPGMIVSCVLIAISIIMGLLEDAAEEFRNFNDEEPILELEERIRNSNNLLAYSSEIVDAKSKRFCAFTYKGKADVFDNITQPEEQLNEMAKALVGWFAQYFNDGTKFKAAVALFDGKEMVGVPIYWPWGKRPSLQAKEDFGGSFFTHVANRKAWDCIPDIKRETELCKEAHKEGAAPHVCRYKEIHGGDNFGSVVGVPIIADNRGLVGVFVVKTPVVGLFTEESYADFSWVLDFFMVRMRLEICLLCIKRDKQSFKEQVQTSGSRKRRKR